MTPLSDEERRALLRLARQAITATLAGGLAPTPCESSGRLAEPGAAFVSLHRGTELRGCLGCIEAREAALADVVTGMAAAAATDDPRFDAVTPAEAGELTIEISVMGELEPITGPDDIVIGRDGLVVDRDGCRGLLLPQVAAHRGWSAATFLAETCRKAGLAPDAWRQHACLYRFEADVFGEADPLALEPVRAAAAPPKAPVS
jgi:AmmeMemoRadiSam system protein A